MTPQIAAARCGRRVRLAMARAKAEKIARNRRNQILSEIAKQAAALEAGKPPGAAA